MNLAERLVRQIATTGPMSIGAYMTACLHDPEGGYYAARPRLGADGDFITAPQISQMFGELIGLWAGEMWTRLGAPARIRLVELGPGDGTLLADGLRAASLVDGFARACEIVLVETSGPLRAVQARALRHIGLPMIWASDIEELSSDGVPLILIANEFLDCLPTDQWVATPAGVAERRVGVGADGALAYVLTPPMPGIPAAFASDSPQGAVIEVSAEVARVGAAVGGRIADCGGAALFIDYARAGISDGDTLQAVRRHEREDPLAHPGEADLTCRPDLEAMLCPARKAGALTTPVTSQRDFLRRLGIEGRARVLALAHPDCVEILQRQLDRLIGADQMGELFKVVCIHSGGFSPSGF